MKESSELMIHGLSNRHLPKLIQISNLSNFNSHLFLVTRAFLLVQWIQEVQLDRVHLVLLLHPGNPEVLKGQEDLEPMQNKLKTMKYFDKTDSKYI